MNKKLFSLKKIAIFFYVMSFFTLESNLSARINPFVYDATPVNIPITNNSIKVPEEFEKRTFSLPRSARILETIEVTYQNVDGSVETKRIILNKKFNWAKKLSFQYNNYNCSSSSKPTYASNTPIYKPKPKAKPKKTKTKTVTKKTTRTTRTKTTTTKRVVKEKVKLPNRGIDKGETIEISKNDKPEEEERKIVKNRISVVHYVDPTDEIYFDKIPQKDGEKPVTEEKKPSNLSYNSNTGFYKPTYKKFDNIKSLETRPTSEEEKKSSAGENMNYPFNNLRTNNSSPSSMPLDYPEFHNEKNKPDPTSITSTVDNNDFRLITKLGDPEFVKFETKDNIIKITTKDRQARHFMLNRPHRIVVDFKRSVAFSTQSFNIESQYFQTLKIGKHNDFYRVVINLKDNFRYKLKRLSGTGYEIECFR
jgi:hypothetical protein